MAIGKVMTIVVDVGQGQCTFVAAYDDTGALAHTMVFDCGTDRPSFLTANNINQVAAMIASMDQPRIELFALSHSDTDHVSLVPDLITEINRLIGLSGKGALQLGLFCYCGKPEYYQKSSYNSLTLLQSIATNTKTPDFNDTQFDGVAKGFDEDLWKSPGGEIVVNMLVGNVIDTDPDEMVEETFGTTGPTKNRVSLVAHLKVHDKRMFICGDATMHTMAFANAYCPNTVFSNGVMVTLPHHGSRATGLNVSAGTAASDDNKLIVKTFAGLVNCSTVTISAYAKHKHPSMELISLFAAPLASTSWLGDPRFDPPQHCMVAFQDLGLAFANGTAIATDYQTLATGDNVYATFYRDFSGTDGTVVQVPLFSYGIKAGGTVAAAPPTQKTTAAINNHACWVYEIQSSSVALAGYVRLPVSQTNCFTQPASQGQLLVAAPKPRNLMPSIRPAANRSVDGSRGRLCSFR